MKTLLHNLYKFSDRLIVHRDCEQLIESGPPHTHNTRYHQVTTRYLQSRLYPVPRLVRPGQPFCSIFTRPATGSARPGPARRGGFTRLQQPARLALRGPARPCPVQQGTGLNSEESNFTPLARDFNAGLREQVSTYGRAPSGAERGP